MSPNTIPARLSSVDWEALIACLAIGLAGVAICILNLTGGLPPSMLEAWDGAPWIAFAIAVLIVNVDAMLVIGSRGIRWVAVLGRVVLGALLVLFTGFGLIMAWLALGPVSAQVPIAFGVMAIAQWFCLRAVNSRLSGLPWD